MPLPTHRRADRDRARDLIEPPTVIADPLMLTLSTGNPLEPLAAAGLDASANAPAAANGAPTATTPQTSFLDTYIDEPPTGWWFETTLWMPRTGLSRTASVP